MWAKDFGWSVITSFKSDCFCYVGIIPNIPTSFAHINNNNSNDIPKTFLSKSKQTHIFCVHTFRHFCQYFRIQWLKYGTDPTDDYDDVSIAIDIHSIWKPNNNINQNKQPNEQQEKNLIFAWMEVANRADLMLLF